MSNVRWRGTSGGVYEAEIGGYHLAVFPCRRDMWEARIKGPDGLSHAYTYDCTTPSQAKDWAERVSYEMSLGRGEMAR